MASSVISSISSSQAVRPAGRRRSPRTSGGNIPRSAASADRAPRSRRTRGLTVNVDLDHFVERRLVAARRRARSRTRPCRTVFSVCMASSTPPQPGHSTFQLSSNSPSRAACRKAPIAFSSSRPASAAKPSTLTRHSSRSEPSLTSDRWRQRPADRRRPAGCRTGLWCRS